MPCRSSSRCRVGSMAQGRPARRRRRFSPPAPWSRRSRSCAPRGVRASACYNRPPAAATITARRANMAPPGGAFPMKAGRFALVLAVLTSLAAVPSIAQDAGASTPLFTAYPQYSAKFDLAAEKFSLITNMLVYDTSGKTFTDVSFKQSYPDGVSVKETFQRVVGQDQAAQEQSSARKVEGNNFFASIQTFKPRQYVVIFNELVMARRLNEITFPGVEISYTDPEG